MDNTLLILGLVGMAVVCAGLFVILFVTVFRFTGRNFMGFLSVLARSSKDDPADDPSFIVSPKPDLRALADSQDFDTALARHVVQDEIEPQAAKRSARNAPPSTPAQSAGESPFPDNTPRLDVRRSDRTNLNRRDDDDDLFGDMLGGGDLF